MLTQFATYALFFVLFESFFRHNATRFTSFAALCCLVSSRYYGNVAWMVGHSLTLAKSTKACLNNYRHREQLHSVPRAVYMAMCVVYHMICDYDSYDAYWFMARYHIASAVLSCISRRSIRNIAICALVAVSWMAITSTIWQREAEISTIIYAGITFPHITFTAIRGFMRRKLD